MARDPYHKTSCERPPKICQHSWNISIDLTYWDNTKRVTINKQTTKTTWLQVPGFGQAHNVICRVKRVMSIIRSILCGVSLFHCVILDKYIMTVTNGEHFMYPISVLLLFQMYITLPWSLIHFTGSFLVGVLWILLLNKNKKIDFLIYKAIPTDVIKKKYFSF